MHGNNEVGTLEPIAELAAIAKEKGVPFHTDACQTVGKVPVDVDALGVDLLSLSAHKFHGPKGTGALYIRKGTRIRPLLMGGSQENNRRAGTLNVPGIVGCGKAATLAAERLGDAERQAGLVERLWKGLGGAIPKIHRNGDPECRLPNILNIRVEGIEGEAIILQLDMRGIVVSSGSACTTSSLSASHVLLAMGIPQEHAHGSVRFSLSHETTAADIDRVIEVMPKAVETLRAMSPIWKG